MPRSRDAGRFAVQWCLLSVQNPKGRCPSGDTGLVMGWGIELAGVACGRLGSGGLQAFGAGELAEPAQGLDLELADALARE